MFVLPIGQNANEILPGLWLGNSKASQDFAWLKEKNITVVFNCTKDLPFHPLIKNCYRVPVDDNLQQQEIRNLELWSFEIIAKLAREYKEGTSVLIHCAAGMQRSAAVTAMYLIATQHMPSDKAISYIRERRPIAFMPMVNFGQSIRGFERKLDSILRPQV